MIFCCSKFLSASGPGPPSLPHPSHLGQTISHVVDHVTVLIGHVANHVTVLIGHVVDHVTVLISHVTVL